jgi:3-oxoadipate enol-lactonase
MSVELNHRINGPHDAPVVVLSNSLGSSMEMWAPQVPALSVRFRVLRYDQRGHGDSPVPPGPYDIPDLGQDVLDLLDSGGIERAHFVGLSMGGMTGMWLAANAPERIDRLVLLCTTAYFGTPETWIERAATVREHGTEAVAEAGVERWLTEDFREREPAVAERMRAMIAAQPDEGYAECCGALERLDLRDQLDRIAAPTLVIAGAQDPSTPPETHAQFIAGHIPNARLEVLDPGAHLINVERATEVTDLILDHLESEA